MGPFIRSSQGPNKGRWQVTVRQDVRTDPEAESEEAESHGAGSADAGGATYPALQVPPGAGDKNTDCPCSLQRSQPWDT